MQALKRAQVVVEARMERASILISATCWI